MATTTSSWEYPTQVAPLASAFFGQAVPTFQTAVSTGYQRPETPLVTPFSEQELAAMSGIQGLAQGPGATPSYQQAQNYTASAMAPISGTDISRYMTPYMDNVTEAAKRRAVENFQRQTMQPMMRTAVSQGGLRNSRLDVERGLAQEGLERTLSDLDATGLQKAYESAMAASQAEKGRTAQYATQYGDIGGQAYQSQVAQQNLLAGVGETQRGMADVARQAELGQELAAQNYPLTTLSNYFPFLSGAGGSSVTSTPDPVQKPSGLTQALGTGAGLLSSGLGLAKLFGHKDTQAGIAEIGTWFSEGGRLGGLSSIVHLANGSGAPTIAPAPAPATAPAPAPATGLNLGSQQARDEAIRLAIDNMAKAKEPVSPEIDYLKLGQRFFNAASVPSGRKTALGDIGAFLVNSGAMYGEEYDTAKAAALKKQAAQESKAAQDFNAAAKLEQLGIERDKLVETRAAADRAARAKALESQQTFYEEKHREFLTETLSGHLKTTIKMKESEANRMLSELREGETIPELFDRLMASKQITRDGNKLTFVPAPAPGVGFKILNPPTPPNQ